MNFQRIPGALIRTSRRIVTLTRLLSSLNVFISPSWIFVNTKISKKYIFLPTSEYDIGMMDCSLNASQMRLRSSKKVGEKRKPKLTRWGHPFCDMCAPDTNKIIKSCCSIPSGKFHYLLWECKVELSAPHHSSLILLGFYDNERH